MKIDCYVVSDAIVDVPIASQYFFTHSQFANMLTKNVGAKKKEVKIQNVGTIFSKLLLWKLDIPDLYTLTGSW